MRSIKETDEVGLGSLLDLLRMLRERLPAIIAFFLIGLVAILGMNLVLPPDDDPNLGQLGKRIDHFADVAKDYNVLFVGTSTTYRGVDPVLLQEVAGQHGCDVRAFNLGIPKLRLTELRYLEERLTPEMLEDYDLLLLAPMALSKIWMTNWSSNRIRYFSDVKGYWDSLVDIWHAPMVNAFPKRMYYSGLLSGAFAYRQLGIGRLASSFRETASGSADNPSGDFIDGSAIVDFSGHGYVALDDEPGEQFLKRGQIIKDNPDFFETLKTRTAAVDDFRGPPAEQAWRRFAWTRDYVADFEVPVGLFLPPLPALGAQNKALAELAEARNVPVLNYNEIEQYPELFEREHWFDYYHLGRSGAELLTRMIGEDICPLIDANRS